MFNKLEDLCGHQSLVDSLSLDIGSWLYRIKKSSEKEVSASATDNPSILTFLEFYRQESENY